MEQLKKTIMVVIMAAMLLATSAQVAQASAYTGHNSIGSYEQYRYGYQGGYNWQGNTARGGNTVHLPDPQYNYPSQPRGGGWFGGGSGWLTGLREPTYPCVAPTHYSSFYRPNCGGGGTSLGGYGGSYGGYSQVEETESWSVSLGFY